MRLLFSDRWCCLDRPDKNNKGDQAELQLSHDGRALKKCAQRMQKLFGRIEQRGADSQSARPTAAGYRFAASPTESRRHVPLSTYVRRRSSIIFAATASALSRFGRFEPRVRAGPSLSLSVTPKDL